MADLTTPYRGGFVGTEHHFALTVYFEDTDAGGVVYYANYLTFMGRARLDMLRALDIDPWAMLRSGGGGFSVADSEIRYRAPAHLGDDLLILSELEQLRAASVRIHHRVMRGRELLAEADVTAAFLDSSGRPQRQPREWVEKFQLVKKQAQ